MNEVSLFMPATPVQVKRFLFDAQAPDKSYELPAHWIPFDAKIYEGRLEVWAYRNGSNA